jgi:hypothetical protein
VIAHPLIDPAKPEPTGLLLLFSPETSPQLVDCSSMHRSVAFQAAMTPFVGAFFSGFLAHSTTAPSVALNSALPSASLRAGVEVVGPGMSLFLRKTS